MFNCTIDWTAVKRENKCTVTYIYWETSIIKDQRTLTAHIDVTTEYVVLSTYCLQAVQKNGQLSLEFQADLCYNNYRNQEGFK